MPTNIDVEYEKDPRRALLYQALSGQGDSAPLTPMAGALQGFKSLVSGLMLRKLEGQYQDRKAAYARDTQAILQGMQPGAGQEGLARALAGSKNPDVQAEGVKYLMEAMKGGAEARYGLTPVFDEEGNAYQASSAGGLRPIGGPKLAQPVTYVDYGGGVQPMTRYGEQAGGPIIKTETPEGQAGRAYQEQAREDTQAFQYGQQQGRQEFTAQQAQLKADAAEAERARKAAEPPKEYKKIDLRQQKLEAALDAYEALIKQSGTTSLPGPAKAKLQASHQAVMDEVRLAMEFGAPTGADLAQLANRLQDPTAYLPNIAEGAGMHDLKGSILEQLKVLRAQSRANAQAAKDIYLKPKPGLMLGPQLSVPGQKTYNYVTKQYGLSHEGALGLVGNIEQESGHDPNAVGDGGKAYGLVQWHPDRQAGLKKYAADRGLDYTDKRTQIDYMMEEGSRYPGFESLKGNDKAAIQKFWKDFLGYGIEGNRFGLLNAEASPPGGAAPTATPLPAESMPKAIPVIKSREEYDALPAGTKYADQDGRQGVKR